jgi:hemoglobin-like flavoprotein
MVYSTSPDSPVARMKRASNFIGLSERDLQLIRQTSPLVRKHAGTLVDALYERLSSFPESADLLSAASASTGEGLARRREALTAWLGNVLKLVQQESDVVPQAVRSTGAVHAGTGKSAVVVPLDLMVLSTASLQNAINIILVDEREADGETVAAWGKLVWVLFDLMASGYDGEVSAAATKP